MSKEKPYTAIWENGYSVVRDANAPEGSQIMMMTPDDMGWFAERLNAAFSAGSSAREEDRRKAEIYDQLEAYGCDSAATWLKVTDENRTLKEAAREEVSEVLSDDSVAFNDIVGGMVEAMYEADVTVEEDDAWDMAAQALRFLRDNGYCGDMEEEQELLRKAQGLLRKAVTVMGFDAYCLHCENTSGDHKPHPPGETTLACADPDMTPEAWDGLRQLVGEINTFLDSLPPLAAKVEPRDPKEGEGPWIPVGERLPEMNPDTGDSEEVLLAYPTRQEERPFEYSAGWVQYLRDGGHRFIPRGGKPTHWMPLPTPPPTPS